jgi:hypothetical protein
MTELSGMRLLIALLCVYLLSPIPARAVDQFEVFPLDNGERGIGTLLYGRSFAIDGDVVVGGAPNSTPPDFDACDRLAGVWHAGANRADVAAHHLL